MRKFTAILATFAAGAALPYCQTRRPITSSIGSDASTAAGVPAARIVSAPAAAAFGRPITGAET